MGYLEKIDVPCFGLVLRLLLAMSTTSFHIFPFGTASVKPDVPDLTLNPRTLGDPKLGARWVQAASSCRGPAFPWYTTTQRRIIHLFAICEVVGSRGSRPTPLTQSLMTHLPELVNPPAPWMCFLPTDQGTSRQVQSHPCLSQSHHDGGLRRFADTCQCRSQAQPE